ncbi:MAG: cupin domain-containing protein [Candidatus Limnocylindria bacterium]
MHFNSIREAPINRRGGQMSYLLLGKAQFGSERLAITWVDCPVGSEQPMHRHPDADQAYCIIAGRGTMVVGNEERTVEPGTLVFIPPNTDHAIRNPGPDPLAFVSATAPPFDPDELEQAFRYAPR